MRQRVPRFRTGQRVSDLRQPLNRLVDAVNEIQPPITDRPPIVIPQQAIKVEIRLVNADTLTCLDVDAGQLNPSARAYNVELPFTFTVTARGGINYVYTDLNNRTADGTEVQQMTPEYLILDQIWVLWIPGGDGSYVDLNVDGRQFAKVPDAP